MTGNDAGAAGDPQHSQQLISKLPALEEEARRLGLYLTNGALVGRTGDTPLLVAQLRIGDVAFSKRVQDPTGDDVDRQVEALGVRMADEDFAEAQERMARNLAAGRSALDDGDEDDSAGL